MWQHEIIESLLKGNQTQEMLSIIETLKLAQTFYMGDISGLSSMDKIAEKTNQPWFFEGPSLNRLPYPITAFEYFDVVDNLRSNNLSSIIDNNPVAINYLEILKKNGGLNGRCVLIARQFKEYILIESLTFNNYYKRWRIFPTIFIIKVGSIFNDGEIAVTTGIPKLEMAGKGNISLLFRNNPTGVYMQKNCDPSELMRFDIPYLAVFLMLINCKNVTPQTIDPPPKVNKKRMKNGKIPLFSYKVLNINPLSNKRSAQGFKGEPLTHNRVHYCRGHFKQYLPNNPLFGKYTGLYWWQSHIKGKNTEGFVKKEYCVKTKLETV